MKLITFTILLFICISVSGQTFSEYFFRFYSPAKDHNDNYPGSLNEIKKFQIDLSEKNKYKIYTKLFNSKIDIDDFLLLADILKIQPDEKQKNELINRIKLIDTVSIKILKEQIKTFKISDEKNEESNNNNIYNYFLDFDNDNECDMIIISAIYIGPSAGYKIYGRNNNSFFYLYDSSMSIQLFENKKDSTIFSIVYNQIGGGETEVLLSICYNHLTKSSHIISKLYYAFQTVLPEKINKPKLFYTNDSVEIRYSPEIINKNLKIEPDDFFNTSTLFGNIVAKFKQKTPVYVLAERKNWAFVALQRDINKINSSLYHGMDDGYIEYFNKNDLKPYICGWLEIKKISKLKKM